MLLLSTLGCGRLRERPKSEYVYVMAKQAYLRDRVAAVSNRVATITNGQQLEVLERQHRWVKLKSDKGEVGWVEERSVATTAVADAFAQLKRAHEKEPVVATASVRDEIYMHAKPGRDTERLYLLPEGEKLQLLARSMAAKPMVAQAAVATSAVEKPRPGRRGGSAKNKGHKTDENAPPVVETDAKLPPQEDWWLVRDSQAHVGWLLSRRLDVDVPDAIAGYSEGQRIVGAYVLATVQDAEARRPDPNIPVYVVLLNAYKDGLPYDFDQVRVFTWSLKKHRYETAYRERGLQGYLPVTVKRQNLGTDVGVATFSFKVPAGDAVRVNASTGAVMPGTMVDRLYRLDSVIVRRVLPLGQTMQRATATGRHLGDRSKRQATRSQRGRP